VFQISTTYFGKTNWFQRGIGSQIRISNLHYIYFSNFESGLHVVLLLPTVCDCSRTIHQTWWSHFDFSSCSLWFSAPLRQRCDHYFMEFFKKKFSSLANHFEACYVLIINHNKFHKIRTSLATKLFFIPWSKSHTWMQKRNQKHKADECKKLEHL